MDKDIKCKWVPNHSNYATNTNDSCCMVCEYQDSCSDSCADLDINCDHCSHCRDSRYCM